MLSSGQILNDRYRITLWLAEGGQSTVYLAADERTFDRQVVIKEFKQGVGTSADPEMARQQFEASARMLSQLNHPGIVQVVDYFFHDDKPILVTEYVPGETLEAQLNLAAFGLPEEQVIEIADQLCDVLSYLHDQTPPVIYRDLTPGNVIFAAGNTVKLIDFGIARTFKEGKSSDTEPFGTAGYAPPEQHGKGQTGPYSDVYSLGATVLRAVTGYDPSLTPFMLPRADRVNGDMKTVSPALTRAIAKATQVDIRKRFQTVEEFRKAIHRTGWEAVPRSARVGALAAMLFVGVALCGGVGLMLASALGVLSPTATPTAPALAAISTETQTPAPTGSPTTSELSLPTTIVPPTVNTLESSPTSLPETATATTQPSSTLQVTDALTPAPQLSEATATATPQPSSTPTLTPVPSPSPTSTPTSIPTFTSTPTPTPTPTPLPTVTSPPTPSPTPGPTTVVVLAPEIGSGDLPQARIDGVAVPSSVKPGQPFEVIVWASNIGGGPAEGGSITLSFPQAETVEILNVDNNIVREEPATCIFENESYARVITRNSRCNEILSYTTCLTSARVVEHPIVESWFPGWAAGKQHFIHVRITPRANVNAVAVNVRAAMVSAKATSQQCNALIAPDPSQTFTRDQQEFPVRQYAVTVSNAAP